MKKIGLLLAGLSCLFLICCCQAQTPDKPVQSKNGHAQVVLPDGWEVANLKPGSSTISGKSAEKGGYFLVIVEAKADFAKIKTIEDYAATVLKIEEKNTKLENRSLSKGKKLTVHGYPAVQYQVTGTTKNVNFAWVKTFVALPTQFSQVSCWTTPSHLEECRTDFTAITESIGEPAGKAAAQP
jgi:hypothetical protein